MASATAEEIPVFGTASRHYLRFGPHNLRLGFRRWRRSRAFWGGLWTILGGLIILAMPAMSIKLLIASGTTVLVGILNGLLIVIFGLFLWFAPSLRQIIGVLIVVLAVASLVTADLGGFLIGMLMAMVGGALGFAWVPTEPRLKKWRIRRRLHLPIPAVQPDLELRGIALPAPVAIAVPASAGVIAAAPAPHRAEALAVAAPAADVAAPEADLATPGAATGVEAEAVSGPAEPGPSADGDPTGAEPKGGEVPPAAGSDGTSAAGDGRGAAPEISWEAARGDEDGDGQAIQTRMSPEEAPAEGGTADESDGAPAET